MTCQVNCLCYRRPMKTILVLCHSLECPLSDGISFMSLASNFHDVLVHWKKLVRGGLGCGGGCCHYERQNSKNLRKPHGNGNSLEIHSKKDWPLYSRPSGELRKLRNSFYEGILWVFRGINWFIPSSAGGAVGHLHWWKNTTSLVPRWLLGGL